MGKTKVCTKCGKRKNASMYLNSIYSDGKTARCKECTAAYKHKHYLKNKEKHNQSCLLWAKENREKSNEIKRKYERENKTKVLEYRKGQQKHGVENLSDRYVLSKLGQRTGLSNPELRKHPLLIEAQRKIIHAKRLLN